MTSLLSAYGNDWNNTYAKTKVLEQKDTDANNTSNIASDTTFCTMGGGGDNPTR